MGYLVGTNLENLYRIMRNDILRRLKILEGHLRKVRQMVEDDAYCIDILHQSFAVRNGLKKVDELILEQHLHSCVVQKLKKGNPTAIDEVLEVFKKVNK